MASSQTTNLVRGWGKSTSYLYIKLTWKKLVFD
ncbi:hypothetical protein SAMN06295926_104145 [Lysinibacillus sp. AC-3]|nr:hypothetical protein SAMN06295926_104145 [Lysinibacillus sp. AC-3]